MRAAAALFLAALAGSLGCSVPLAEEPGLGPVNTCSSTSDCADGAACQQGMCVATSFDLRGLLLEVRPPAGTSYVIDPGAGGVQLQAQGGAPFVQGFPVNLPPPFSIMGGQVLLDQGTVLDKGCTLSIPARLTFYRVPKFGGVPLAGLPYAPVQVTTSTDASPYTFDLKIVSGKGDQYDVYIEPLLPSSSCSMNVPPVYLPAQTIDANWTARLPPIGTLQGVINGLMDTAMWQVDLVEPARGLPISANTKMNFNVGDSGTSVTALISPVQGSDAPILRLTPIDPTQPDPNSIDTTRPSVYFSLQGAISGTKANPVFQCGIDDLATPSSRVHVNGTVASADGLHPMAAQLTIQSQKLSDGSITENVAYSAQVNANETTGFDVDLPTGTYTVRAAPLMDNGWSITDNSLTVTVPADPTKNNCMCSVPLHLDAKTTLAGAITTPTGQPLATTNVGINPSQQVAPGYLYDTHHLEPIAVRVESTATDVSGGFSLLVDNGIFDLVVQPDPATNFPWLVVPRINPATSATMPPDAKSLTVAKTLTSPAILQGVVLDPNGVPVTNAEIDAWFPLRDSSSPNGLTGTVVKIATTSTDASGRYTLVLPSSITPLSP